MQSLIAFQDFKISRFCHRLSYFKISRFQDFSTINRILRFQDFNIFSSVVHICTNISRFQVFQDSTAFLILNFNYNINLHTTENLLVVFSIDPVATVDGSSDFCPLAKFGSSFLPKEAALRPVVTSNFHECSRIIHGTS